MSIHLCLGPIVHLPLQSYENQPEVAEGIKKAYNDIPGLKREDLFIVSELVQGETRSV